MHALLECSSHDGLQWRARVCHGVDRREVTLQLGAELAVVRRVLELGLLLGCERVYIESVG
jgi:hypothetical protein